eukprot:scaffold4562_cov121-Isochrysis_galbana.AAC.1
MGGKGGCGGVGRICYGVDGREGGQGKRRVRARPGGSGKAEHHLPRILELPPFPDRPLPFPPSPPRLSSGTMPPTCCEYLSSTHRRKAASTSSRSKGGGPPTGRNRAFSWASYSVICPSLTTGRVAYTGQSRPRAWKAYGSPPICARSACETRSASTRGATARSGSSELTSSEPSSPTSSRIVTPPISSRWHGGGGPPDAPGTASGVTVTGVRLIVLLAAAVLLHSPWRPTFTDGTAGGAPSTSISADATTSEASGDAARETVGVKSV